MTQFKTGDRVRCNRSTRGSTLTEGHLYVVRKVSPSGNSLSLEGINGSYFTSRFSLVTRPKPKTPITAIKVPTDDVMVVLTRYVKEELGIDATVDKVISSFTNSLELVFKEAA
ncbi:hypothetical protein RWE87_02090 [Sinorhizobium meliloti]|uniref:hypothetical protein n=1 Tax=Rhizobium meliloti TaxID=382 RepID=UPI00299CD600|nr:hypothetical protein [Sinorhizobium meliloti]